MKRSPLLGLLSIALLPQTALAAPDPVDLFTEVMSTPAWMFEPGAFDARRLVVASGDVDAPPYTNAAVTERGNGYDGVVSIQIQQGDSYYICSGSVLRGGMHVLTAAHCLADAAGNNVTDEVTVVFFPQGTDDYVLMRAPGSATTIKAGYSGAVIDPNDLAVIALPRPAPAGVQRYDIYGGDPVYDPVANEVTFEFVGFGRRGSYGMGAVEPADYFIRRNAFNLFDFDWGTFDPLLSGLLVADFDDGTAAHDANCWFAEICQMGVPFEGYSARGDSGGPAFVTVGGRRYIAGVTSWGATLGPPVDIDDALNSSYGEIGGWVAPGAWAAQYTSTVPEPASIVLLLSGLVGVGAMRRGRRNRP